MPGSSQDFEELIDDYLPNEDDSNSTKSRERTRFKTNLIANVISLLGWLIIASNLISFIFAALPIKIADPAWLLSRISSILSIGFPTLIGFLFVCIAPYLNPKSQLSSKRARFIVKVARFMTILMLLLIPVQFFVGSKALKASSANLQTAIKELKKVRAGISLSQNEEQMRTFLRSLQDSPTLPAKFNESFPIIKERAVANLTSKINAATTQGEDENRINLQAFLLDAIRNTFQCLLIATGFAAVSRLHRRNSIGFVAAMLLLIARFNEGASR